MSGLLVQLDEHLLVELMRDGVVRQMFCRLPPSSNQEVAVLQQLAAQGGLPRSSRELLRMPVLCTSCQMIVQLGDALGLTGAWAGACARCDQLYWTKEFPDAVKTLLRIDWRHAFDAIVGKQGNMLVRPMLRPMYQEKSSQEIKDHLLEVWPQGRSP